MIKHLLTLALIFALSACSAHKVDVQQGNVLTKETMDKIKIGMSDRQISALLGTPLINDPFRKDRWDFIYSMKQGSTGKVQYSYVSFIFKQQKLSDIKIHQEPLAEKELITPGLGLEARFF